MLTITIQEQELYDESDNRFYTIPETTVELEHSLLAISKWESKWHIPFLKKNEKTKEQVISYTQCMCVTPNVPVEIFFGLNTDQIMKIAEYIDDPMTATTINSQHIPKGNVGENVTSELIYYWMNEAGINKECENWHLNRLIRLIEVTSIKRQPPKKMSRRDAISQQRSLNAARRARLGSKG